MSFVVWDNTHLLKIVTDIIYLSNHTVSPDFWFLSNSLHQNQK